MRTSLNAGTRRVNVAMMRMTSSEKKQFETKERASLAKKNGCKTTQLQQRQRKHEAVTKPHTRGKNVPRMTQVMWIRWAKTVTKSSAADDAPQHGGVAAMPHFSQVKRDSSKCMCLASSSATGAQHDLPRPFSEST